MECQYCKNIFKTKDGLRNHQRKAQYCLKLREDTTVEQYECKFCNKSFNRNYTLIRHQESCSNKKLSEKDEEINQLKDRIKELENKLLKASSRPTNKIEINTYIQNMKPVTFNYLTDNTRHLTIEHIKKGAVGYAEYALEYPLKDRMICSDYARRKVKFKDREGNIITDPEMTTLAKKFFTSIQEKNKELICKSANELKERLGDENVMDTVAKLFEYKESVNRGSNGEKTDFHHDFVRQVCSQTLKEI